MPIDWVPRCRSADIAYSGSLHDNPNLMPEVGNGFVATVVSSDTIFAAGVFNGDAIAKRAAASARARIPSFDTTVDVAGAREEGVRMMDFEHAVFTQRRTLQGGVGGASAGGVRVEDTWYAHAVHRNLLVHEITLSAAAAPAGAAPNPITVRVSTQPSDASADLDLKRVASATAGEYAVAGANKIPEVKEHTSIALAGNVLSSNVSVVPGGASVRLLALTVVVSSLEEGHTGAALGDAALALLRKHDTHGAGDTKALRASHEAAWKVRHDAGHVEAEGDQGLALAINASLYFIRAAAGLK